MPSHVEGARASDWYLVAAQAESSRDAGDTAEERARHTLLAIREARFGGSPRCPRCGGGHVQSWGHFGIRRRFRCPACRRTFSDLTNTAFAYGKRLDLWLPYAGCLLESLSVRVAGRRLGIDKDTAWRWRHRLLAAHATLPTRPLRGTAELADRRFGVCEKGRRRVAHPLHRATRFHPTRRPSISVLFARDEGGATFAATAGPFPLHVDSVEVVLAPRANGLRRLVAPGRPGHPIALFANHHRLAYEGVSRVSLRSPAAPGAGAQRVRHVMDDVFRFCEWLRRFRGVATRYLDRYLHWHAMLERVPDPRIAFLLAVGRAPPQTTSRRS